MSDCPVLRLLLTGIVMLAAASTEGAGVQLSIDYTYDTGNFFGSGNPDGAAAGIQAKAALEAAADFYSDILADTFSAIQTPSPNPFHSAVKSGVAEWHWTLGFRHPSTDSYTFETLDDQTIPANQYRIYAGARSLSGNTLGEGGAGSTGWSYSYSSSSEFTPAEYTYVLNATESFLEAVESRGETSGFSRWGGAVSFDDDDSTNWHYNHTTNPTGGTSDFYSVAIHELAHTLGFGEIIPGAPVAEWESLVTESGFSGTVASAEYGATVVPLSSPDNAHWVNGTSSAVFGTATSQEAAMTPTLTQGTRKRLTDLDAAALTDIGWTVVAPPSPTGDYNDNGVVDAADYTVWRDTLGDYVGPGNGADGSGNGWVGEEDYTIWKNNFGAGSAGSGTVTAAAAVPEPSTVALMVLGGLLSWARLQRQDPRRAAQERRRPGRGLRRWARPRLQTTPP